VRPEGAPVGVEVAELACQRALDAAYRGDARPFARLYDPLVVRERALAGLELEDGALRFADEVLRSLDPWTELTRVIEAGGDVRCLRAWVDGGATVVLVRLTLGIDFDYHRYFFGRDAAGRPRIVDVVRLSEGEGMAAALRGLVEALPEGAAHPPVLDAIAQLGGFIEQGDVEGGLRALALLPSDLRENADVMRAWVDLASLQGPEEWNRAIDQFEARFPSRTDALFARLGYGIEYADDAAREVAVARLLRETSDSAFVEYLLGHLDLTRGQWDAARAHLEAALVREPGYEDPLWDLLQVHAAAEDFSSYGAVLERLELRFGYAFADLASDPHHAAFTASGEFAGWEARRKERAARKDRPAPQEPGGRGGAPRH